MLSLDITKGSSVFIGDDIEVKFKRHSGSDCIRLCIQAPPDVKIQREKLYREANPVCREKSAD